MNLINRHKKYKTIIIGNKATGTLRKELLRDLNKKMMQIIL